ncbi:hypothetical protein RvY_17302 [Ramazzottius varieornatus]|uniref:UBR-type domain-containing protein n=1 Tax=Ramazzottius varieornatus TaxID=947166 RepID=A0A1D1W3X3_RAMVA|nr:hypothetical protein RvY_17302 [Ramazzottius varieornatus]
MEQTDGVKLNESDSALNGQADIPQGLKRRLEEDSRTPPRAKELKIVTTHSVETVNGEVVREQLAETRSESVPADSILDQSSDVAVQSIKGPTTLAKPVERSAAEMDPFPDAFSPKIVEELDPDRVVQDVSEAQSIMDAVIARQLQERFNYSEDDEEDVAAVLGDCDDKECSYSKGYLKRQALYSCVTCYDKSKEMAGICLACTYNCHDGHEFVELYTKRNFRCDCGNSKFSGLACKLAPEKDVLNEKNQYTHNFMNEYCVCNRPYPDPARQEQLVQVQCTFCEDWFHMEHVLKDTSDLEECLAIPQSLVCQACLVKHPFTQYYVAEEGDLDFEFDAEANACKVDGCALKFLQQKFPELPPVESAGWTPMDWYKEICRCEDCKEMYAAQKVEFLLDYEESVEFYEEKGREKAAEAKRKERESGTAMQEVMSGMGRFQQIEFASSVLSMQSNLSSFMREINDRGEAVTAEQIRQFFEGEKEKLKERRDQLARDGI